MDSFQWIVFSGYFSVDIFQWIFFSGYFSVDIFQWIFSMDMTVNICKLFLQKYFMKHQ